MEFFRILPVILGLLIIVPTSTLVLAKESDEIEEGDQFVDKIVKYVVEEHGDEFDPFKLDDHAVTFHKRIMLLNITAELKLRQGYVQGLKTLHRAGNCKLTEEKGLLSLQANLGAGLLNLNYTGDRGDDTTIAAYGSIPYMEIVMTVSANATTGEDIVVKDFSIKELKGMEVWITGLGPMNWVLNSFIKAVTDVFREKINNLIERRIEKIISDKINDYKFPIERYNETAVFVQGDVFVDNIIKDMFLNHGDIYDPHKLIDIVIGFGKKVMFVNISGEVRLYDGYISGMKTLHRAGHCVMSEESGNLKIYAKLGARALEINYDGIATFMRFGPKIKVSGYVAHMEVAMKISMDSKSGTNAVLEEFYIDHMSGLQVWMSGLGPLNWAFNIILRGVTNYFQTFLRNLTEEKLEQQIASEVGDYKFPVECRCGKKFDFSCC